MKTSKKLFKANREEILDTFYTARCSCGNCRCTMCGSCGNSLTGEQKMNGFVSNTSSILQGYFGSLAG